jgi:RNA polymerase sigma-70 factor (sigma-E family)
MMAVVEAGSAQELVDLYRDQYRSMVRLASLLLDDVGSAEEVVQDAFVSVHRSWDRVADPARRVAYLRSAVLNGARSGLRRRRVRRRYDDAADPRPSDSAEAGALLAEDHREVLEALRALPKRQRDCLVLRYYLDLSEADIAATLGISTGSVKTHAHRGMAALAVALREEHL